LCLCLYLSSFTLPPLMLASGPTIFPVHANDHTAPSPLAGRGARGASGNHANHSPLQILNVFITPDQKKSGRCVLCLWRARQGKRASEGATATHTRGTSQFNKNTTVHMTLQDTMLQDTILPITLQYTTLHITLQHTILHTTTPLPYNTPSYT